MNIAIFVDVQNIYYTTRAIFKRQFNYRELWQRINQQGQVVCANAYAIHRIDDKQHKFRDALKNIGFTVKLKPYIQRQDGSAKGDWDVGIAIDVMEIAPTVDKVVLLSGDGDFAMLLERIMQKHGVVTEVYSVKSLSAKSLMGVATRHYGISESMLL